VLKTVRNIAIILLLAAAVAFIPGGDTSARVISSLLSVIFLGGLVWFAVRLYREHRATLFGLGDKWRALLYGAAAVIVLTLTATSRLFDTDVGILIWFALMGASIYALFAVWRFSRRY
jgi:hypothetical protein